MVFVVEHVHIKHIKVGDAIMKNDQITAVCKKDIKHHQFMGKTLFGDSYCGGAKLVMKIVYVAPPSLPMGIV